MDKAPPPAETIEGLFAALESPLLHYARRLLPDETWSEDVVQEAFVRLHAQFAQVRSPRNWLYRTVHNLALNRRRQQDRIHPVASDAARDHSPLPEPTDPQPLPDEWIARWEGIGLVRLNLPLLDARSQEVLRLKFVEELSYEQIAQRTGLKSGYVGYLLHHALKSLSAELAKAGLVV